MHTLSYYITRNLSLAADSAADEAADYNYCMYYLHVSLSFTEVTYFVCILSPQECGLHRL